MEYSQNTPQENHNKNVSIGSGGTQSKEVIKTCIIALVVIVVTVLLLSE